MSAFTGIALFAILCVIGVNALEDNEAAGVAAVATSASPTNVLAHGKQQQISTKKLAAIMTSLSKMAVKIEKLTNRVDRLTEMNRMKVMVRKMGKKSRKSVKKIRRGAAVSAASGKRGAAVAVSASRRNVGSSGASHNKKPKRKAPTKKRPVTAKPKPAKKIKKPMKKNKKVVPGVNFHKTKRGGTSVAVSAGSASAGAAA